MIRKEVTLLVLISFIFPLIRDTLETQLPTPVKMRLRNGDKLETYILCFTEHGFITWNSSIYNPEKDFEKFAEYYTYEELHHIKMPGRLNPLPAIVGTTVGVINLGGASDSEDLGAAAGAVFLISLGVIVSFFTIFIPRSFAPTKKTDVKKFPEKYYMYHSEVPTVAAEFIAKYEK